MAREILLQPPTKLHKQHAHLQAMDQKEPPNACLSAFLETTSFPTSQTRISCISLNAREDIDRVDDWLWGSSNTRNRPLGG